MIVFLGNPGEIKTTYKNGYRVDTKIGKPDMIANIATDLHTTSDFLLGIENDGFDYPRIRRMIARNASSMTESEKEDIINALFGEE